MKMTKEGFIWKIIPTEKQTMLWNTGLFPMFILHEDDTETLLETDTQFLEAYFKNETIGIEVGHYQK